MSLTVRALSEFPDVDEALATYHRTESAGFGTVADPAHRALKRPLVEPDHWYLAEIDGEPSGGAGSFPVELTVPGGATVPAAAVSDVSVLPTHRRRGALTALMARQLEDLANSGTVAAVLHASEARIYERFGYGTATLWRYIQVSTARSAFRDGWPDPGGRYRLVPREEAHEACAAVHDRVRRLHPGALSRSAAWWQIVLGDAELYIGGGTQLLVILHEDDSGTPDGFVIYQVHQDWSSGGAAHRLSVSELVGTSPSVELGLWRTVLDHDLVATVTGPIAIDHALFDVLVDPRQARTRWEQDLLWARVLDIPTALTTRTYRGSGALTLTVEDRFRPQQSGTYRLEVDDGKACCERVAGQADLHLDVSDLSACWLGGGSLRRLARVGRVQERVAGVAGEADTLFRTDFAPWCWVRF